MKNLSVFLVAIFFIVAAFTVKQIAVNNKSNEVVKFQEIKRPGYETSPAHVEVYPSAKKTWSMVSQTASARHWRTIGALAFWAAIILLVAAALNYLPTNWKTIVPFMLLMVVWLAGTYAAFSSAGANNKRSLTPEQYEVLSKQPGGLDALFNTDQYIR